MNGDETLKALQTRRERLKSDRAQLTDVFRDVQVKMNAIDLELSELDTAERVLEKLALPRSLFPAAQLSPLVITPANWTSTIGNGHAVPKPTTPEMILAVVRDGKGESAAMIIDEIEKRWHFKPDSNVIRPTLWRMTTKDHRLERKGDGYAIPQE